LNCRVAAWTRLRRIGSHKTNLNFKNGSVGVREFGG
jgi:hypothetical protein